jgi:hypothetical protein
MSRKAEELGELVTLVAPELRIMVNTPKIPLPGFNFDLTATGGSKLSAIGNSSKPRDIQKQAVNSGGNSHIWVV